MSASPKRAVIEHDARLDILLFHGGASGRDPGER